MEKKRDDIIDDACYYTAVILGSRHAKSPSAETSQPAKNAWYIVKNRYSNRMESDRFKAANRALNTLL